MRLRQGVAFFSTAVLFVMFGIVLAAWQLMAQDDTTLHVGSSPQEADEIVRMARQYLETDCEKDKTDETLIVKWYKHYFEIQS